jgi:glycerol-3-phosphate dehydrogenase
MQQKFENFEEAQAYFNGITYSNVELNTNEIDFIIAHFNRYVQTGLTRSDVRSVFAGLRPLVKVPGHKKTAVLPRDHTIWVSKSKMVSVSGGKWTTYRKMAQETVLKAHYVGKLPYTPCQTEHLRIHGAIELGSERDRLDVYGSDASGIRALQQEGYHQIIHDRLPYTTAEVIWMARNEMAITVEDILSRRTRSLFLDAKASVEAAPLVASLMAKVLNKDAEWEQQQVAAFLKTAEYYMI